MHVDARPPVSTGEPVLPGHAVVAGDGGIRPHGHGPGCLHSDQDLPKQGVDSGPQRPHKHKDRTLGYFWLRDLSEFLRGGQFLQICGWFHVKSGIRYDAAMDRGPVLPRREV